MEITAIDLERELADMFANPFVRDDLNAHWANGDYHAAALVVRCLLERRLLATPQLPAAVMDPSRSGGTAAGVPIERLAALAGETP